MNSMATPLRVQQATVGFIVVVAAVISIQLISSRNKRRREAAAAAAVASGQKPPEQQSRGFFSRPPTKKDLELQLENLMLNAWDAGRKADIAVLLAALNRDNVNYQTRQNGWTPLMVLAGLKAKGTISAIREAKEMGANPTIVDGDGWNALHWAAFHDSLEACRELAKDRNLLTARDFEGKTPEELARSEGNKEMAAFLKRTADWTPQANSGRHFNP